MTVHPVRALLLLLVAVSTARTQGGGEISDSSGIRIIDHRQLRVPTTFARFSASPLLELDTERADPDHELDFRRPYLIARRLGDRRWVLGDLAQVKLYDSTGKFVRAIGRRGDGPGEFRQVGEVCIARGDTIVVASLLDRRVEAFDTTGRYLGGTRTPGNIERDPCTADGSVVVRRRAETAAGSSVWSSEIILVSWKGQARPLPQPLEVESADRTFPGIASIIPYRGGYLWGNGNEPEYRVLDSLGAPKLIVRWARPPVEISNAARAEAIRRGFPVGSYQRMNLPFYRRLFVGGDGSVWVQDEHGAAEQSFLVFGSKGEMLGRVTVPIRTRYVVDILEIRERTAVLAYRDSVGVPRIRVYALERIGP